MSFRPLLLSAPFLLAASTSSFAQMNIEEVIVTADFFDQTAYELPTSITVIDSAAIKSRGAEHLEDLLALAPNVNFATGASRGRFIQIRGIGERSEFIEPVNYSVGVLIDGIDFTGISTAATTLDISQVEIFRGPQGTLYGANALAGLINLVSEGPSDEFEGYVSAEIGNFNSQTFKGAFGGSISDTLGFRVAAQSTESDGFYTNTFLNRDDTNNIDETSARAKLRFAPSERLQFDLTAYYADIDNGYDVFNYESDYTTISNTPGADEQETTAFALSTEFNVNDQVSLEATLSHADSDILYSFDEDWRNPSFCIENVCTFGPDGYNSAFDTYTRTNENTSADIRIVSAGETTSWVLGVYHRDQEAVLDRVYIDGFGGTDVFGSRYDTENSAIYGDLSINLTDTLTLSAGARIEDRTANYLDTGNFAFDADETLNGGRIALTAAISDETNLYALVSKGYKAGGANSNPDVDEEFREYDTETLFNYEIGYKGLYADGTLSVDLSLFYQDREDIQTDSSIVDCSSLPCSFDDFLTNAATGSNTGVEASLNYKLSESLSIYGSLGLLDAEYGSYENFQHVDTNEDTGEGVDLNGRDQPHAPSYQFFAGTTIGLCDAFSLDVNIEGKDGFFFSNDHEFQSDSYVLLNAQFLYETDNWSASVWGKNLADEEYQTRAFGSFGNNPSNGYETELYSQLGSPRTFGITGQFNF